VCVEAVLYSNIIFRLPHTDYCSESPQPFPTLLCLSEHNFKVGARSTTHQITSRDYCFTGLGVSTRVVYCNWCPTVSYSALHCPTMSYSVLRCPTVPYSVLQCPTVSYGALQCPTVPYNALQCPTMPYNALQCLTVPQKHRNVRSDFMFHLSCINEIQNI